MKAPLRSHGFDKPADLEDELAQFDEERADPILNAESETRTNRTAMSPAANRSLQQQIDELRKDLDGLHEQVEALHSNGSAHRRQENELSAWLPMVRSVAVTSLAGRIFASSPIMAILVAAVPFALGLSAGSK